MHYYATGVAGRLVRGSRARESGEGGGQRFSGAGLGVVCSVYREKRKWSDRVSELELPLFPGYVFCRIEPEKRGPVQMTPGVVRIVGSGRVPLPIEHAEMEMVRALADSDVPRRPYPEIAVGDRVEIRGGPLSGVKGVLEKINDRRNLVVSITLLRRSVAVEIDDTWVTVKAERV